MAVERRVGKATAKPTIYLNEKNEKGLVERSATSLRTSTHPAFTRYSYSFYEVIFFLKRKIKKPVLYLNQKSSYHVFQPFHFLLA